MRLPDFLQFTPDERRAALAILLFTGGGGLLLEISRRHPEWTPGLLTPGRKHVAGVKTPVARGDSAVVHHASVLAPDPRVSDSLFDGAGTAVAGVTAASPVDASAPAAANPAPAGSDPGSSAPSRPGGKKKPPSSPVNVNTAGPKDLMSLPGIGPSLAQRIVDDRARNGPFRSLDDLGRVKGIGKKMLARFQGFVITGP